MSDVDDLRADLAALRARVRMLEDHVEITDLVAQYGPAVDSGSATAAAALWTDDGEFVVPPWATWKGDEIAGMVEDAGHQDLIMKGCAHVLTTPHIIVDGDEAHGWSYALNLRWDADTLRFWVARVSANSWHWQRTADRGWRIVRRDNHALDGSEMPRAILRQSPTAAR